MAMNRCYIISIFTLFCVCASAQTQKDYYVKEYDEVAKDEAMDALCEKYDKVNKASFATIFDEAFKEYVAKIKKKYVEDDIRRLKQSIEDLEQDTVCLRNMLDSLRYVSDSLAACQSESRVEAFVNDSIDRYREGQNAEINLLKGEKAVREDSISGLKKLVEIYSRLKSVEEELARKQEENKSVSGLALVYNDTKTSVETCYEQCKKDDLTLLSLASLFEQIDNAIDKYDNNKSLLTMESDKESLSKEVDELKKYKALSLGVAKALNQMKDTIFVNSKNKNCSSELQKAAKGVKLSTNQRKELNGIIDALKKQQYAYTNLRVILNEIMLCEKVDDENRKDVFNDCVVYNVRAFNGSNKEEYSGYYEHFNRVLRDIKENVNHSTFDKEGLERYVKGQKQRLKSKE